MLSTACGSARGGNSASNRLYRIVLPVIGGDSERPNMTIVHAICDSFDRIRPRADKTSHRTLIRHISDRPGHDRRYAVNSAKIAAELGWAPKQSFESGLERTIAWYLDNQDWCNRVMDGSYRDWLDTQYAVR